MDLVADEKKKRETAESESKSLRSEIEQLQGEISRLSKVAAQSVGGVSFEEHEMLKTINASLEVEKVKLDSQLEDLKQEKEALLERVAQEESSRQEMMTKSEDSSNDVARLKSQVEGMQGTIDALKEAKDTLEIKKAECTHLRNELNKCKDAFDASERRLSDLSKENETVVTQLGDSSAELDELRSRVSTYESASKANSGMGTLEAVAEAKQRVESLQTELARKVREAATHLKIKNKMLAEVRKMESQLATVTSQLEKSLKDNAKIRKKVIALERVN